MCHWPGRSSCGSPIPLLEAPIKMLLPLLLLLLLLLPLSVLWWQKSLRMGKAWGRTLQHSVALRALSWAAALIQWRLEKSTRHVHQGQEQVLHQCLKGPRTATYPLGEIPDLNSFRNQFPLVWPRLDPYSKTGETDEGLAMLQHPQSNSAPWDSSSQVTLLSFNSLKQLYPGALIPGGTARLTFTSPWPSSLPWPLRPLAWACPPGAGAGDPRTLILAALGTRGLQVLEAGTATELLDVFSCLGADWEGLVEAVAAGMPGFLPPAPNRAAELKTELEQGPQGLARRLWPQLQVVVMKDAGGQDVAKAALGNTWCQGLPFFSPAYVAAGGVIGLNPCLKQLKPGYLLLPGPPFVELLPAWEKSQQEAPSTLLLGEALQGEEYELVLTNDAGLTRCPLGDVVQVIDFYHQCPIVRFVRRLSQSLNVRGEGISEDVFSGALLRAVGLWPGAKLLDYCCAESGILGSFSDSSAPHYEVFVELRGVRGLSEEYRHKLDHCLQEASPTYKSLRFRGSIGPAQVHLVGQGGFRELRALLSSSPSLMPLSSFPPEMPRILKHRNLIQFLLRRVVS